MIPARTFKGIVLADATAAAVPMIASNTAMALSACACFVFSALIFCCARRLAAAILSCFFRSESVLFSMADISAFFTFSISAIRLSEINFCISNTAAKASAVALARSKMSCISSSLDFFRSALMAACVSALIFSIADSSSC